MKLIIVAAAGLLVTAMPADAAQVCSRSGICVGVAPSARAALQCVVNYVERHGVRVRAMRGYGHGTVAASLHPSGQALDINQTARNVALGVPRNVANAAGRVCGVVSGGTWRHADNGHWNVRTHHRRYHMARR